MERKAGPAGGNGDSTDAGRPSTSSSGTDATKGATIMAHFHDDGQGIQGGRDIPSPEIPARTLGTPGFRDEVELDDISLSGHSSPGSISSGSVRMVTQQTTRVSVRSMEPTGRFAPVVKFWRRNVVLSVPQKLCRDHFALERTYLAYFRTALNFAMLGVFIAQLFSLQHMMSPGPHDPTFGFFRLGLPLSCACYAVSIVVSLLGAYRFWRQQQAMAIHSKVHVGGWELNMVALLTAATIIVLFVLVVIITARRG